jgi:hypothetical protein
MPGSVLSIANTALPSTLVRESRRRVGLPISGRDQHLPRGGADHPKLGPARGDRLRAARHLDSEAGVRVDRSRRSVLGADLAPVALEFLGKQHRQRGKDALAELELADQHGGRVVGRDADERGRRVDELPAVLGMSEPAAQPAVGGQTDGHREPAADDAGGLQELAP